MKRALVVYKRSFLERHKHDPRLGKKIGPAERRRMESADRSNRGTLQEVQEELEKRGIRFDVVYRGVVALRRKCDLVVTVGGDGTFFHAAQEVGTTPVLGVNSDTRNSLGLHCGADRRTFPAVLDRILAGKATLTLLNRLSIRINAHRFPAFVVNDVLFAAHNPAAMSRYHLSVDGASPEDQRSSGMWISTAAGSTAGIYAAGGKRMPIRSKKIQYLVREPYIWPRRLRRVRGEALKSIAVHSMMDTAAIWLDGSRRRIDLALGDKLTIQTGATPLRVFNLDESRWRKYFP